MHIQESRQAQENTQAKCSTMTEDGHRKSGMNGIIDGGGGNVGAAIKQHAPKNDGDHRPPSNATGGRLKFFKDGKFILELARAREGERMSWVSVPRKTFWPPQASTGTTPPAHRQESSNSLSVSDDNSSVQSSPWQRDHSWKQNTPRCNVSSEMTFFYHRPTRVQAHIAYRKRRRPFDSSNAPEEPTASARDECDSSVQSIKLEIASENSEEISDDISDKEPARKLVKKHKKKLVDIIKVLWDKKPPPNNLNAFKSVLLTSSRHEQMVSPRKRILRELERVTIDDHSNKRSRAKPTQSITFTPGTSCSSPSRAHNGSADAVTTKNTSSYSITSLLGHRKDDDTPSPAPSIPHNDYHNHNTQLSPNISQRVLINNISPSPKTINYSHSPKMIAHHDSPDLSPSPEHYRYVSQQNLVHNSPTHALSPPPDVHKMYQLHGSPNHYSPLHGMVMHQKSPQYYTPSHRSAASPGSPRSPLDERTREQRYTEPPIVVDKTEAVGHRLVELEHSMRPAYISPYMYPPTAATYLNHPAYYGAGAYRSPYQVPYVGDPLTHPPSPQQRSFVGHQPWNHLPPSHTLDTLREDITSDVPLNLSKHAG